MKLRACINAFKERVDAILPYKITELIRKILNRKENTGISKEYIYSLINNKKEIIILDIGAYNGKDTRKFLNLFKNSKVYSFEPDIRCIRKFKRRIRDKRCKLFEIAISDKDGVTDFYLSDGKDMLGGRDGSSSIKKPKEHLIERPEITFNKKIKIRTKKLDTWAKENNITHVDFIWADVQGAERELINGGIETLKKTKYFYTEFDNKELYENQPNLKEICKMLPMFEIVGIFEGNVLLQNKHLVKNKSNLT